MKAVIKIDGKVNPIQICSTLPYFSFYFEEAKQNAKVESYRLLVGKDAEFNELVFDTGDIESDITQNIVYAGSELEYGKVYYVAVLGKTNVGNFESDISTFETPIKELGGAWLKKSHFTEGLPIFGYSFNLPEKEVVRARLYATALGIFEPWMNGKQIGNDYLAPGWTDYKFRVPYETYDIKDSLCGGKNAFVAYMGMGWYAGRVLHRKFNYYGKTPLFRGKIYIEYADGTSDTFVTDGNWKCVKKSPYIYTDNFDGEIYDARLGGDFSNPDFDFYGWYNAEVADDKSAETTNGVVLSKIQIIPDQNEPTRCYDELKPVSSFYDATHDVTIFDLGQNFGGTARFLLRGKKGDKFTFRYGEMLDNRKIGTPTLYVENLRSAKATDEFYKGSDEPEIYEPKFTFHGYRYIEVNGNTVTKNDVLGIPYCSFMKQTGNIKTDVPLVNKLFDNILWGQRSNYISVPTDCPQRDERGGWSGDAEVFCATAAYNFDISHFMNKYIDDLIDGQNRGRCRSFPNWAPLTEENNIASPAWGDAGTIIPARMYSIYRDKRFLHKSLQAMIDWADCLKNNTEYKGILYGHSFGDWLSIVSSPRIVTDTAFYAHTLKLISQTAEILGCQVTACKYNDEFERIKKVYNEKFVTSDFHVFGNTQTVYCLTLAFDLIDSIEGRKTIAKRLVADIQKNGNKITGGFIGISYVNILLSQYGYSDVAYNLLLQKEYPSWLYPVLQGATTIWERWNSYTHTNGFGDVGMNSFNHYSMGAVGQWIYEYMLGIRSEDGFKTILLTPSIDARMGKVSGSYESPYGTIAVKWHVDEENLLHYDVTLPANTSARLVLPVENGAELRGEGGKQVSYIDGKATFELSAGKYKLVGKFIPTCTPDLTAMVDYNDAKVQGAYRKSELLRAKYISRNFIKATVKDIIKKFK